MEEVKSKKKIRILLTLTMVLCMMFIFTGCTDSSVRGAYIHNGDASRFVEINATNAKIQNVYIDKITLGGVTYNGTVYVKSAKLGSGDMSITEYSSGYGFSGTKKVELFVGSLSLGSHVIAFNGTVSGNRLVTFNLVYLK